MAERRRLRLGQLFGPALGLIAVCALFGILEPRTFLSVYNFQTVAAQTVMVGFGAIGMTFVIVAGGIDLSMGSVIALVSVVTALTLKHGAAPLPAVGAGLATGLVAGLVNGLLVTRLRIVPFIVTLGTMGIARGIAMYLANEQKIDAPAYWLATIMDKAPSPPWLLMAPGTWLMFALALLMGFILQRSVFGVHTYAIGSNEATARLCGIRVPRVQVLIYTLAGLFAGLAGVMQYARLTVGDPTTAVGKELDVIAAVVIGGASLNGGVGGIGGSLIGAFLMSVLANGCTLTGVPNYVQQILVGVIIIVAVAMDRLRHRKLSE